LDSLTSQMIPRRVNQIFSRQTDTILAISLGSEIIEVTPDHPFWVVDRGWVASNLLQAGDNLLTASGAELPITSIETKHGSFTVYNLDVDNLHNYFVSREQILVHNCGNSRIRIRRYQSGNLVAENELGSWHVPEGSTIADIPSIDPLGDRMQSA